LRGNLTELNEADRFTELLRAARGIDWVVYAKPPFGGPKHVLEYLGRYTHRVAIANSRLTGIGDDTVSFRWKDYRHHDRQKIMTLDADEFIRRFLLHVLPDGFQRIRHYGLLGNRARESKLGRCRQLLDAPPPPVPVLAVLDDPHDRYEALTGRSLRVCPICSVGIMQRIGIIPATVGRARPVFWADTS
jgi:Putative transposase